MSQPGVLGPPQVRVLWDFLHQLSFKAAVSNFLSHLLRWPLLPDSNTRQIIWIWSHLLLTSHRKTNQSVQPVSINCCERAASAKKWLIVMKNYPDIWRKAAGKERFTVSSQSRARRSSLQSESAACATLRGTLGVKFTFLVRVTTLQAQYHDF